MTHQEALSLIDNPYLRASIEPSRWADLGCGSGIFTLALAEMLGPGSTIEAIDLQPTIAAQTTDNDVTIKPQKADFEDSSYRKLDGVLMANSLHFIKDQRYFLGRMRETCQSFLLVEYDTDRVVHRWVPFPLSYKKAVSFLTAAGWTRIEKLGTRPSSFGRTQLYAALALPEE